MFGVADDYVEEVGYTEIIASVYHCLMRISGGVAWRDFTWFIYWVVSEFQEMS